MDLPELGRYYFAMTISENDWLLKDVIRCEEVKIAKLLNAY